MNRKAAILTVWCYASLCGTKPVDPIATILPAIEAVESGGNPNAIGDSGKAVGILQLHTIMVDDCNRIVGETRWTYADRSSQSKSEAMFRVYSEHYSPSSSFETIARRWNGGPKGDRKPSTLPYWKKVKAHL